MTEYNFLIKHFEAAFIDTLAEKASLEVSDMTEEVMYDLISREVADLLEAREAGRVEFSEDEMVALLTALRKVANGTWTDHESEKKVAKALSDRIADEFFEGDARSMARFVNHYQYGETIEA